MAQEDIAAEVGKGRQTIGQYESGTSDFTFYLAMQWAIATGKPPAASMAEIAGEENGGTKREMLSRLILSDASDRVIDMLWFYFFEPHGSDVEAFLNKGLADLQSSMQARVASARLIGDSYEFALESGNISVPGGVKPDLDMMYEAIHKGRRAAIRGEKQYRVKEGGNG